MCSSLDKRFDEGVAFLFFTETHRRCYSKWASWSDTERFGEGFGVRDAICRSSACNNSKNKRQKDNCVLSTRDCGEMENRRLGRMKEWTQSRKGSSKSNPAGENSREKQVEP